MSFIPDAADACKLLNLLLPTSTELPSWTAFGIGNSIDPAFINAEVDNPLGLVPPTAETDDILLPPAFVVKPPLFCLTDLYSTMFICK
mgnify:CR=1 FL=1